MHKLCIFCGKRPESKNLEHVLPQWLIRETGDPKRIIPLGPDWRSGTLRRFSFDQLKFPACSKCNISFSSFEQQAKNVVIEMLGENSLNARSFDIFLTWLDKIRVGLWLGYRYLDGDLYGITPKYYINQRIRNKDRMVLIYKADDSRKGIIFMLVNTPFFAHAPTCFVITINQFYFVNVSTDFLLSRRLGLPFPRKKMMAKFDPDVTVLDMQEGLERILMPLLRLSYNTNCTEIYQPIISREIKEWMRRDIYQRAYIKRFFNYSRIGRLLIKISDNKIVNYPSIKTNIWIPRKAFQRSWAHYIAVKTALTFHDYLISEAPSTDLLSDEEKKILLETQLSKGINLRKIRMR